MDLRLSNNQINLANNTNRKGASFYTTRLDDPQAVYLTPEHFPVKGDGITDDTDALQQAINTIQEKTNQGTDVLVQW